MKIEHVALNVPEPARIAQWYADNFGMRIVRAATESPYIHFIADSAGTGLIELYNNPAAPVPDYPTLDPQTLHIAFVAEDMEKDRARLLAAEATAAGDVITTDAGDQLAMFRDPWGIPFQLTKRRSPLA